MKPFEEIKDEILKRAKEAEACKKQYQRAYKAKDINELLVVIKENLQWSYGNMGINADFLEEYFGVKILNENQIYTSGENSIEVKEGILHICAFGSSSVNVETLDSSSANVKTLDSSSANVKTWDRSSANIKTLDSSSANVETWDSSSANVETLDSSSANVKTWGSSSANVETLGSSSANIKTLGSSSKLTFNVESINSLIRCHNERKIYINKNSFEIIEV